MVLTDDVSRLQMSLAASEAKAAMLDALPTPVLQIGRDYTIAYINPAGAALLGVNRQHVVGMNSHTVLRTPECHAGRCICHQTVPANGVVDGEAVLDPDGLNVPVRYTAAPMEDNGGNQVGTLISLHEVGREQRLAEAVRELAQAVTQGDLSARAPGGTFSGYAGDVVQQINAMLEAIQAPIHTLTRNAERLTQGNLAASQAERFPGELGDLQQALTACRDGLLAMFDEVGRVTAAMTRGKFERRVDPTQFRGQWGELAGGLNAAIEALLLPVRDISRSLEKLAAGNVNVRVTTTYQGDFHVLKRACNDIGAQLQLVQETITGVKQAVARGDLSCRGDARQARGRFADVITAVNDILETVNSPIVMLTDYLERIAGGALPGKIIDEYKGHFQSIKSGLNGLIDYLQQVEYAVEAVAHGDLACTLAPRSEADGLARAVGRMRDAVEQFLGTTRDLTGAIQEGRLDARGDVSALQGEFTTSMRHVNRMLDAVIAPLRLNSEYIDRIAAGNLPARLNDTAPGDFGDIQQRTNACVDVLNRVADELTMMAAAAEQGNWDARAHAGEYDGIWSVLMNSANATAMQVSAAVEDVGGMLHRLAAGEFDARLAREYAGDYNVLKRACHELGDQMQTMRRRLETLHADIDGGRFDARLEIGAVKGEFSGMLHHVNRVLDAMNTPARDLAAYIAHLAEGTLPDTLTDQYQGDFQRMRDGLNAVRERYADIVRLADAAANGDLRAPLPERSNRDAVSKALNGMLASLAAVTDNIRRQVHAIQEGRLGMRGNTTAAAGCWRDLLMGMNTVIDTCVTPFMVMTDYVNRIAAGDVPEKITEEFRGEFNSVRNTLNRLIDTIGDVKLVAREISNGNLEVAIQERSDKDELMKALQEMLHAVRDIAESPEALAKGWRIPLPQEDGANSALRQTFQHMVSNFQAMMSEMEQSVLDIQSQNWLRAGQTDLESILRDAPNAATLAKNLITFLVKHVKAHVGAVYLTHVEQHETILRLTGSYAYSVRKGNRAEFALGEGLIGQAALEKEMIVFSEVPEDYVVSSGLGRTQLRYILVLPFLHAGQLTGVIELGTVREFSEIQMQFLRQISDLVAFAFHTARAGAPVSESLDAMQERTELRLYQDELRVRQQELEQQVAALQESRARLFQQEDDLRGKHTDLDAQTESLRRSEQKLEQRQEELRQRQQELEAQARALRTTEQKLQQQQQQLQGRNAQHALQQQSDELRESEQRLEEQRAQLRRKYEELESRARMLKDSEDRVGEQRSNLRAQYDELESKGATLKQFEERLKAQQDTLEQRDSALSRQMQALEAQQQELREQEQSLETTRRFVQEKMKELEQSGRYRPEFLINMSYKLRTSLNRLLVLSNLLAENKETTLTDKQVEFARSINSSVTKLLALVNQVLHLTKIESGSVDVTIENISVRGLTTYIEQHFMHLAQEKGLFLHVNIADELPVMIKTSRPHVEQILKHLLSNAVKFTAQGSITVHIGRPASRLALAREGLTAAQTIAISVIDTGIGIPSSKFHMIFEAFQQADTTISQRFGGMGLGLAICRGLAHLLGGELHVESEPGTGSTFTLCLPENAFGSSRAADRERPAARPMLMEPAAAHDQTGADTEPDLRSAGEQAIMRPDAAPGKSNGRPEHAVTAALRRQRPRPENGSGRAVPDGAPEAGASNESAVTTEEPPQPPEQAEAFHVPEDIINLLPDDTPEHPTADPEPEPFGFDEAVTRELQQVEALLLEQQQELKMFRSKDAVLNRRTILVVSRERGSVYTLSNVLQEKGAQMMFAETGKEALQQLESRAAVDLVLVEHALAGKDGSQVTRMIRKQPRYAKLPIIALVGTMNANDYQRCLDAGANDYLFKPVDTDELVSLLRVWLY